MVESTRIPHYIDWLSIHLLHHCPRSKGLCLWMLGCLHRLAWLCCRCMVIFGGRRFCSIGYWPIAKPSAMSPSSGHDLQKYILISSNDVPRVLRYWFQKTRRYALYRLWELVLPRFLGPQSPLQIQFQNMLSIVICLLNVLWFIDVYKAEYTALIFKSLYDRDHYCHADIISFEINSILVE